MSTIDSIKAAKSKADLEKIAHDEFGQEVDKRRGLETLRADVLEMAEAASEPAPAEEKATQEAQEPAQEPQQDTPAPTPPQKTDEELREERRLAVARRKTEHRRLKNTKNGRVFVYTADLAKKPGMVEVTEEE